jgi:hypothetical protein
VGPANASEVVVAAVGFLDLNSSPPSPLMHAALRIQAIIRNPQPFHRAPANQVLAHDLGRILRLHIPVPDRLRVHHHHRTVFTLVQASGLIDAHLSSQPGSLGTLLQLGE